MSDPEEDFCMITWRKVRLLLFACTSVVLLLFSCKPDDLSVTSPDGALKVTVTLDGGQAHYSITRNDTVVLAASRLGVTMTDADFSDSLSLVSVAAPERVVDDFTMAQGKRAKVHYEATQRIFQLKNGAGARMDVLFRVSDDGVAFRYGFPEVWDSVRTISGEVTSFHFTEGTTAFLQPMSEPKTGWAKVNPCYEEFYEKEIPAGTPSPSKAGWVYPALFHAGPTWLLITEAGLNKNYCGTHLLQASPDRVYSVAFPDTVEVFPGGGSLPSSTLPWYSPWRVIAIGSLKTIMESDLGIALADKAVAVDTSYIKPGHSSWSWALLKDDSITYDVQKKFIDHAADMKWEYCLIDVNWDTKIGYDKIKALAAYAATRNVGLILWYNSAGDWNETPYTPKNMLLTQAQREKAFAMLRDMGIKGVKIDFFGGDGQSMIGYYLSILEDAARFNLLVNFHGSTIPRGWHRTYPNLMSMEAVKGFEYVTFEQKNADEQPAHCSVLPFARNVFDPMDFTPLSLDSVPRINRRTTAGFELALPVVFHSGIQHFVETPVGMRRVSGEVKDFLRDLPVQWDDTKFISGYPGKEVVLARKKNGTWYIGGINGEAINKTIQLDLSALHLKHAEIITDTGKKAPAALAKQPFDLAQGHVAVKAYGGFVIVGK